MLVSVSDKVHFRRKKEEIVWRDSFFERVLRNIEKNSQEDEFRLWLTDFKALEELFIAIIQTF